MDAAAFVANIKSHPKLRIVQTFETNPRGWDVICKTDGLKPHIASHVELSAVDKYDWPTLASVLMGYREPMVLEQMTRVCGYYSRVSNWNKSKIGELKDRHRGDYSIGDWKDAEETSGEKANSQRTPPVEARP